MGQQLITHSCGHDKTHNIVGPIKDRDRKAAYLAEGLCDECYRAKQQADREAAATKALETAAELGLPELDGTPKQVAWAAQIRDAAWSNYQERAAKVRERFARDAAALAQIDGADAITFEAFAARTSAHWWIENRGASFPMAALTPEQTERLRALRK